MVQCCGLFKSGQRDSFYITTQTFGTEGSCYRNNQSINQSINKKSIKNQSNISKPIKKKQ